MLHLRFLSSIKSLILGIFAIIRKAFCCFSRKRRLSYTECEILTSVNVVEQSPFQNNRRSNEAERDWNSWDDSPRTVDEHIEHYRQRLAQPKDEENKEPALDFFQDMEPKVVKQQKVFINTNKTKSNNDDNNFSRLQASSATDFAIKQTSELEDWSDHDDEDATQTGWDEINDDAAKEMIRQKRREQRAQRNQRVQQQKLNKMQSQAGYSYHA